jgi:transcriptional regulator with XRE-family HTH domain
VAESGAIMVDGERIRWLRYDRGIDFHDLASRAGVSRNTLRRLERGLTRTPTPTVLKRVANALGVSPGELMAEVAGEPAPSAFPTRIDTAAEVEAMLARLKAMWVAEGSADLETPQDPKHLHLIPGPTPPGLVPLGVEPGGDRPL